MSYGRHSRRRLSLFALATIVAFLIGAVRAQEQPTTTTPSHLAADNTFYLDLDTAAGSFSQWRMDDLGTNNTITAEVQCPRIRKESNFVPAFGLHLQDAPDNPKNAINVQVAAYERKLPMRMKIVGRLQGQPIQPIELQTIVKLNEPITVQLSWDASNLLKICAGSELHLVRLGWLPKSLVITGSTGQFKVSPLVVRSTNDSSASARSTCAVAGTQP